MKMKFVLAIFLAVFCYNVSASVLKKSPILSKLTRVAPFPANEIDDAIIQLLEQFRQSMAVGVPELGIPPTDPLYATVVPIEFNFTGLWLNGVFENVTVENLSTFQVIDVSNDLANLKANFSVDIPSIYLYGKYNMTGFVMDMLDLYGDGPFTLEIGNFSTTGMVTLQSSDGTNNGTVSVKTLDIHFSIGGMKSGFENLNGGGSTGELLNSIISDSAAEIIALYNPELSAEIAEDVKALINPLLGQFTLGELLQLLGVNPTHQ